MRICLQEIEVSPKAKSTPGAHKFDKLVPLADMSDSDAIDDHIGGGNWGKSVIDSIAFDNTWSAA
jgi:hypothetical protein